MKALRVLVVGAALCSLFNTVNSTFAQGTAFTYEGQLQNNGSPASGTYNLQFTLFNTNTDGTAVAGPVTTNGVIVANGLFTVLIDFGPGVFTGTTNWLEIGVETNGFGSFTNLAPRQELTPVPYAIYAESAAGLPGLVVQQNAQSEPNLIGGAPGNFVTPGIVGATIGGGGGQTVITPSGGTPHIIPVPNSVTVSFGTVGGGQWNTANGAYGTVGGGFENTAGNYAAVGGGSSNNASGTNATVGGGINNSASSLWATVSGGSGNIASSGWATVGGGSGNNASGAGATVGGGAGNSASGSSATVGGGESSTASGEDAAVGGGYLNLAIGMLATVGGGSENRASGQGATVGGGGYDGSSISGNSAYGNASVISGGSGNTASGYASTVAGGDTNSASGPYSFIGGGHDNTASAAGAVIGGGGYDGTMTSGNIIQDNAATIGGGLANVIPSGGTYAVIGGGQNNTNSSAYSTIGGGFRNLALPGSLNEYFATIGGGFYNTASNRAATVSGGEQNTASNARATVGGGYANTASGPYATVGGGLGNQATATYATVPGGLDNTAGGTNSFAAGQQAQALHQGAFVWADSQAATFASTAANQFLIRAEGYVGVNTNGPVAPLHVVGARTGSSSQPIAMIENLDTSSSSSSALRVIAHGGPTQGALSVSTAWPSGGTAPTNVLIAQFGNQNGYVSQLDNDGNWTATSFVTSSDRNAKENFQSIAPRDVLDRVSRLPISRWNYKVDKRSEHIGPMAQDFHAAFKVGMDDKHIATVDEEGVALAAIQGLNEKLNEKDAEIESLKQRLEKLEQLLNQKNGGDK